MIQKLDAKQFAETTIQTTVSTSRKARENSAITSTAFITAKEN